MSRTEQQVRDAHAPDPRHATWNPAAAASIAAADAALSSTTEMAGDSSGDATGAGERWDSVERHCGARERHGIICRHDRDGCVRRLQAWAMTLPTAEQSALALQAADVVRQGR